MINQSTMLLGLKRLVVSAMLAGSLWLQVYAQTPGTTRYVYDENGRLIAVIAPTGEAAVYEYDPAGNITAIRRLGANAFELLSFAPTSGTEGDRVSLYGVGIGVGASAVRFNGVAAQIVEATPTRVIVTVPNGATTGPITLTATRGTATTKTPFTVRGIALMPLAATLIEQEPLQFTATAATVSGDQRIVWSVNNIAGGNATVGAISATGLYVAPRLSANVQTADYTVRAMSVEEPELFREATVTVRNRSGLRTILAGGVSVDVPITSAITGRSAAYSPGVSVSVPVTGAITSRTSAYSAGVSVAVILPAITAVSPKTLARGATVSLTITGTSLTGVNALRFFKMDGTLDTAITVTNLSVASATMLTATVSVSGTAATGRKLIVVATPTLPSIPLDTASTTLEVTN
jgi:YD repeat-containing protein